MMDCEALRNAILKGVYNLVDSKSGDTPCIVTVPWTDNLGEPLRVVVTSHGDAIIADDDGAIFFSLGRLPSIYASKQVVLNQFIKRFLNMHGLEWNQEDQIAEVRLTNDQAVNGIIHFAQTVNACIMALPVIVAQDTDERGGHSLGPRLATRIYKEFETWTTRHHSSRRHDILRLIKRRHLVQGMTNPRWKVDFYYQPVNRDPGLPAKLAVVLITVDLAVKNPLNKAEHAVTMSRDIALRDSIYTVRLAFDDEKQYYTTSEDHRIACDIITNFSENSETYQIYDMGKEQDNEKLQSLLRIETAGGPLFR